jgi:hypothetical protein
MKKLLWDPSDATGTGGCMPPGSTNGRVLDKSYDQTALATHTYNYSASVKAVESLS